MTTKIVNGNIFTSKCQVLVNTVNCVGVMGAGIALECRLRYPEMHTKYIQFCNEKKIDIGKLWLYKSTERWVLNFPTKRHWKHPSKIEYLEAGLEKFLDTYDEKGITSIAFPLLGADKGGIPQDESLRVMESYLKQATIDIEIYRYSPTAADDFYEKTKEWLLSQDIQAISDMTKLRKDFVIKLIEAVKSEEIFQLNQLARVDGIGIKTLEKIFNLARNPSANHMDVLARQKTLI